MTTYNEVFVKKKLAENADLKAENFSLKAENEVLRKAIEEAYNILCLVETGQEHHEYMEITNDDFQALKKALAGKEAGK